jgi:RNA polymerase sigma factor (sigma-70 family)
MVSGSDGAGGRPGCDHWPVPRIVDRAGDRTPADVYARLAPAVLGFFRSHRMRDPEGLTGDVFVAVTEKLPRFRGDDAALRRWVFTIAHNRRIDEIRRSARRQETLLDDPDARPAVDALPFDPGLAAALGRLTAEQREVLVLRYVADLPIAAVARITGRRPGAVKMLQARGLEALGHLLEPADRPAAHQDPATEPVLERLSDGGSSAGA